MEKESPAKIGCCGFLKRRRKNGKQSTTATAPSPKLASTSNSSGSTASSARSIPELYAQRAHCLREFSLKDLAAATKDFSSSLKIGEGGFGTVYRGSIASGTVAIKKLNANSLQGHKQWLAEVQLLGIVDHPNLVKLVGYCSVDADVLRPQRLLVYEFMPNKTLDHHLFNRSSCPVLPWQTRIKIALGAAEGLLYLHHGLATPVIYRDFKAANILLDEEFMPKLSDFGLAREGPSDGRTHVTTAIMGTYGYAAPDYVQSGHLTTKSDVWSYGMVLYELLTGRRSMEKDRPKNEQRLLELVRRHPADSSRFRRIMDPRLRGQYSAAGAREVARLADKCLSKHGKDRPAMSEVVEMIKKAMEHTELNDEAEVSPEEDDELCCAPGDAAGVDFRKKEDAALASRQRRLRHLAKLRESTHIAMKRRFVIMDADAAQP